MRKLPEVLENLSSKLSSHRYVNKTQTSAGHGKTCLGDLSLGSGPRQSRENESYDLLTCPLVRQAAQ